MHVLNVESQSITDGPTYSSVTFDLLQIAESYAYVTRESMFTLFWLFNHFHVENNFIHHLFQVKPLIWIESVIEKFSHSRVEIMVKVLNFMYF